MRFKGAGALMALAAAIVAGLGCGMLRAPYAAVVLLGLAAAGLGFWLERATLVTPETVARKDFGIILAGGLGMFAVVGVGVAALAALLATWWLPRI